jgi:hypothetical protein
VKNFVGAGHSEILRRIRNGVECALGEIIRRGKCFADGDLAAFAQDNAICKSPANIGAEMYFPF